MTDLLINLAFRTFLSYVQGTIKNPCSPRADKIVQYGELLDEEYKKLEDRRAAAGCGDQSK